MSKMLPDKLDDTLPLSVSDGQKVKELLRETRAAFNQLRAFVQDKLNWDEKARTIKQFSDCCDAEIYYKPNSLKFYCSCCDQSCRPKVTG